MILEFIQSNIFLEFLVFLSVYLVAGLLLIIFKRKTR